MKGFGIMETKSMNSNSILTINDIVKPFESRATTEQTLLTFEDGDFLAIEYPSVINELYDAIQVNLLRFTMQKINPSGIELANTFDMASGMYLLQENNQNQVKRLDIFDKDLLFNAQISNDMNVNLANLFCKQSYDCTRVFVDELIYLLDREDATNFEWDNIVHAFKNIKDKFGIKEKLFNIFTYNKQDDGFLIENHFDALIVPDSSSDWIDKSILTNELYMSKSYALYLFLSYFFIEKQGFFNIVDNQDFIAKSDVSKNKALLDFFTSCKIKIAKALFEESTSEILSTNIKQISINDVLGYLIYDEFGGKALFLLHYDTYLSIIPDDDIDAINLLSNIEPANLGIPFETRSINGKQVNFVKVENLTPKRMTQLQALIKDLYDKKQINDNDIKKLLEKAKRQMPDELKDINDLEALKKDLLIFLESSKIPAFKNYASEINAKLSQIKQKNTIIQAQKSRLQENLVVLKRLNNDQETPIIKEIQAKIFEIDSQINDANNRIASINQSIASLKGLSFTSDRYLPKARQLGSFGVIPAIYFVTIPLAIVVVYCVYQLLMPLITYVQELLNYTELAQKNLLEKTLKELKDKEKELAKQREIACNKDPNSQDCISLTKTHEEIKKEIQQKEKEKEDLQKSIDNKKWVIVWKSSIAILGMYAGYKLINTTVDRVLPSKKDKQNNLDNKENKK